MNRLEKVILSNMCAGCGLCVSSPEEMVIDERGFARPVNQIFDNISLMSCPGIGIEQLNRNHYNSYWGPVLSCEVGYSTNPTIRQMGSSGGVLTALTYMCLNEGIVDAVIQTGASTKNPIANQTRIVTSKEELIKNAGSRYAPSSPLSVIRQLKGNKKKYAFVGKPCDIAALRMAMRVDKELNEQFPILLSFMCAGVPGELASRDIIQHLGLKQKDVIEFRYRGDGWPGLTKAITNNGKVKTMTYNESWGMILNKQIQARCKLCADGTGELADVVCADAWHNTENGYPSFEEKEGRSLILIRTLVGKSLLEESLGLGYISGVKSFDIQKLKLIQPYQYNRKSTLLARLITLKTFGIQVPKYKGFDLFVLILRTPIALTIRGALGTFIRKVKGRL